MTKTPDGNARLASFLLIEDDEDHAALVMRSLEDHRIKNRITHIRDGSEAINYLFRSGKYKDRPTPDVILLDLKLPKVGGHEILRRVKEDPILKVIPVVILTTSGNELDRSRAYDANVNSYLVKPMDFGKFRQMTEELKLYWGVWNQPAPSLENERGATSHSHIID